MKSLAFIVLVAAIIAGGWFYFFGKEPARQISAADSDLAAAIEAREFDTKMISSGDNIPTLRIADSKRAEVLVLLHEGMQEEDIRKLTFSDGATGATALNELLRAGYIKSEAETLRPSVAVMTLDSVAAHMKVREEVAAAAFGALASYAPAAIEKANAIPGFSNLSPEAYSFYILSDVLLDDPQINNVEQQFLNAQRPQRPGGRYYLSIQEKPAGETKEAFGIYGNHVSQYDGVFVGVYGNNRNEETDFHWFDADKLWAGDALESADEEMLRARRTALVASFVSVARGETIDESEQRALTALGWLNETGAPAIPFFASSDLEVLPDLLGGYTPTLIDVLNAERPFLEAAYEASPYADEIAFEEYFIWWYHLFYSEVTNRLISADLAYLPPSGVTTYVYAP